jgi:hypothetical protein
LEKREISRAYLESNHDFRTVRPVAWQADWLRRSGFIFFVMY